MLLAVDDSLGRILVALERKAILNDTMIVFTSDHGYFYGEHGLKKSGGWHRRNDPCSARHPLSTVDESGLDTARDGLRSRRRSDSSRGCRTQT